MLNIKILLVAHKPFKIPDGKYYTPIHAGRGIALELSKDGKINNDDLKWMIQNTIGDDSGDNITTKNRYYSECSALYWAWKNYDAIGNPDYIGLMHYRRHFIFNDKYFNSKLNDDWHKALSYINENFINTQYQENIGLNDSNILQSCENYELIVSKDAQLKLLKNSSLRDNYKSTIPGAEVKDFDLLIKTVKELYPQYSNVIDKNIDKDNKTLYQMFIMKKELFFEYCDFLFNTLFEIEKHIDFSKYTTNGKRTMGYLAEILMSIYVWYKQENGTKILKLGVSEIKYPYTDDYIKKISSSKIPSYFDYIKAKLTQNKEIYQALRRKRKDLKELKKLLK